MKRTITAIALTALLISTFFWNTGTPDGLLYGNTGPAAPVVKEYGGRPENPASGALSEEVKLYAVTATVLAIWSVLGVYLFLLDRRIRRLENRIDNSIRGNE